MAGQNENSWFFQNAANFITALGFIFLVWLWVVMATVPEEILTITVLAGAIGLTDLLDGWTARKLHIMSTFGEASDRLRDKLFICSILAFLAWISSEPLTGSMLINTLTTALVVGVIILEGVLLIFWFFGVIKKLDLSSRLAGKIKMSCQFAAVTIWLISLIWEKYYAYPLLRFSVYLLDVIFAAAIICACKSCQHYHQRYTQT